jgi:hypothetical protein
VIVTAYPMDRIRRAIASAFWRSEKAPTCTWYRLGITGVPGAGGGSGVPGAAAGVVGDGAAGGTPPGEGGWDGRGAAGPGTWYPGGRSYGDEGRCTDGSGLDGETRGRESSGWDGDGVPEGLTPEGVAGAVGDVSGVVGPVEADEEGRNAVWPIK